MTELETLAATMLGPASPAVGRDRNLLRWMVAALPVSCVGSVLILEAHHIDIAVWTHQRARRLDATQRATGQGPGLEVLRTGSVVGGRVTEVRVHWPVFARSARDEHIHAFLCLPLRVPERAAASVNLYGEVSHAFDAVPLDRFTVRARGG